MLGGIQGGTPEGIIEETLNDIFAEIFYLIIEGIVKKTLGKLLKDFFLKEFLKKGSARRNFGSFLKPLSLKKTPRMIVGEINGGILEEASKKFPKECLEKFLIKVSLISLSNEI